jgi:integrase
MHSNLFIEVLNIFQNRIKQMVIYNPSYSVTCMKINTPSRRRKGNSSMQLGKKKIKKQRKVAREIEGRYAQQLLKFAASGREYRVCRITIETGMHPTVMADPKAADMENDKGQLIWHRPKTGALCVWDWEKEGFPSAVLDEFLTKDLGFTRKTYWNDVRNAASRAGLNNISPLTLRHTAVHIRLNRGESPKGVQRIFRMSTDVLWGTYAEVRGITARGLDGT